MRTIRVRRSKKTVEKPFPDPVVSPSSRKLRALVPIRMDELVSFLQTRSKGHRSGKTTTPIQYKDSGFTQVSINATKGAVAELDFLIEHFGGKK